MAKMFEILKRVARRGPRVPPPAEAVSAPNVPDAGVVVEEFVLSQDLRNVAIENDTNQLGQWRWMTVMKGGTQHMALVVVPPEAALTPVIDIGHDIFWRVHLMPALESMSADGLAAELFFRPAQAGGDIVLFTIPMRPGESNEIVATFELRQLAGCCGRLGIRCTAGPLDDCTSDWLAIVRSVVAREDRLGLLSARANPSFRLKNELANFDIAYDHPMYAARVTAGEDGSSVSNAVWGKAENVQSEAAIPDAPMLTVDELLDDPVAAVREDEDVYRYADRVLGTLTGPEKAIDFAARLKNLSRTDRPLRLLTVCSGAAGVERQLLANAGVPVDITLLDINENLMQRAAAALAPHARVRCIVGDANSLSPQMFDEPFDIVISVSALHHLVELERVATAISGLLADEGEFWMIGEQVGRDGNRLWPESAVVANQIFSRLPPELRRNSHTGQIDQVIPDIDFSASSFEGIRSSEIESIMQAVFEPILVWRGNCFLWRIFEMTYFSNYDLSDAEHRRIVLEFVVAEYNLWMRGGRPTQCFAVYQRNRGAAKR